MTPAADLSTWLSKPEAAARLGISERTLDRLVAAGKGPECRNRQRSGKRPEPVYNPVDIEVLLAAASKPAVIAPSSPIGMEAEGAMAADIPHPLAVVLRVMEQLAAIAQRPRLEAAQATQSLWLTIGEAAAYTGLSEALLRRLVRAGQLPAIRDRAVKVRRADLDNLATTAPLAILAESPWPVVKESRQSRHVTALARSQP